MRDEVQNKMGPGEGTIISFFRIIKFHIGPHYVRITQKKFTDITINKMNHVVVEVEQKTKTQEENMQRNDKVVAIACRNFAEEGIKQEIFLEAKVIQLGEIAEDLRKKVTKLEVHIRARTPPEFLEEQRKVAT